jgi:hypothetical protein
MAGQPGTNTTAPRAIRVSSQDGKREESHEQSPEAAGRHLAADGKSGANVEAVDP